jgi:alkanesulfonate monooxygenase SsuD/methylene tetrahydromethanopterin reductase-like flavin-dependent oxidoreductase (luciferase family)
MHNANRLKLGVFGFNCSSGLAATTVPERWDASWANNLRLARLCDEAGIEFLLPIARWKGYGGATDFEGETWETITWAGGLLAITRAITVFGTVHVALVHPVFAAKQFVTVDHMSGGRFGLNIVCGWNQDDFDMFGVDQRQHDDRYEYGEEWWEVVKRIWTSEVPFDVDGRFLKLRSVIGKPRPVSGRPDAMNAAASTAGRRFAARNCDFLFTKLVDLAQAKADIEGIHALATEYGRRVGVYCSTHVVLRPTRREAQEYYRWYVDEMGDWEAADRLIKLQGLYTQSLAPSDYARLRRRFAGGHGTYPIVGDADDVAAELQGIAAAGFAGLTVSFVNFLDEFPAFADSILPRLEHMGLRQPRPALAAPGRREAVASSE